MGNAVKCCVPEKGNTMADDDLAALRSGSTNKEGQPAEASVSQKKAASLLKDFNASGDDVKELTAAQLSKLQPVERFEKLFPFYRMDINGFQLRTKQAKKLYADRRGITRFETILEVRLSDLQTVFKPHESWNALNDPSSDFVSFLRDTCAPSEEEKADGDVETDDDTDNPHISLFHLRCIALLWCDGSNKEKGFELYDMMQDNDQPSIAASDKDFLPCFNFILKMATELTYKLGPKYLDLGGEQYTTVTDDEIAQKSSEEVFESLSEDFLDDVFGSESTLSRKEYEEICVEKVPWLFSPKEIRKKLEYA
jgi:hypothetical protein